MPSAGLIGAAAVSLLVAGDEALGHPEDGEDILRLEFEGVEEALGGGARVAVGGWHEGRGIDGWPQVDDKNRHAHRKRLRRPRR